LATLSRSREEPIRDDFSITRRFNNAIDVGFHRSIKIERVRYGSIRRRRDANEILRLHASDDIGKMVSD
jgi:hypothetical protein